jgi:hypothetical protein
MGMICYAQENARGLSEEIETRAGCRAARADNDEWV